MTVEKCHKFEHSKKEKKKKDRKELQNSGMQ